MHARTVVGAAPVISTKNTMQSAAHTIWERRGKNLSERKIPSDTTDML
jgi:hypothetical protein